MRAFGHELVIKGDGGEVFTTTRIQRDANVLCQGFYSSQTFKRFCLFNELVHLKKY